MRYSFILALAPISAYAAPARMYGRAASDVLVFKFADVLEQLESSFYTAAIAKFQETDFTDAGFTSAAIPGELFPVILADEAAHSSALQAALKSFGEEPITSCAFNFDAALGDVATTAATARVVEMVGVGAYLGGATLLTDPVLLDAAASILTIEARHQTILNILSGTGSAIPQPFDIALTPSDVLAIAGPFFDGACDLGIAAQPTLSITNTGSVNAGTLLTFASDAINGTVSEDSLFCNMMIGGAAFSISLPLSQCIVPEGIDGPVAIWITSDGQPLINNVRDRATNKQIAGPTIAYIDSVPQTLSQLVRGGAVVDGGDSEDSSESDSSSEGATSESTSTETISPEEASSFLATATNTASDSGATDVSNSSSESSEVPSSVNTETGVSPDGKITVDGWTTVPA